MTTNLFTADNAIAVAPAGYFFDYNGLDVDVATEAKKAVKNIRKEISHTVLSILNIGHELERIKDQLPHGQFGNWIDAEFGMTARTAQNYMSVVRMRNAGDIDPAILEAMPQKLLYELSGPKVPGEIVIDVIETIEKGNTPDVPAVLQRIRDAKQMAKPSKQIKALIDKGYTPGKAALVVANSGKAAAGLCADILKKRLSKAQFAFFREHYASADKTEFSAKLTKEA